MTRHTASPGAFAWLHPQARPGNWTAVRIPSGATMAYPQGWRAVRGDRGTASAALFDRSGRYVGYLNLTPRQGHETLRDWPRFRVEHNHDENHARITTLAVSRTVPFTSARGNCIKDAYRTPTGAHYIEVACFVTAEKSAAVIVGAAPPQEWSRVAPVLERSIASVTVTRSQ